MLGEGAPEDAERYFLDLARRPEPGEVAAEAWFWVSAARTAQGLLTEASLALGKALDLPQSPRMREKSLFLLGEIYLALGNLREAESRYRLAQESAANGKQLVHHITFEQLPSYDVEKYPVCRIA